MKKLIPYLALASMACTAQAATTVIDLEMSDADNQSVASVTPGGGTPTVVISASTTGPSQTHTYSITGLTLDSNGTGDDSVTFTMNHSGTSTSGTVTNLVSSFAAWGVHDGTGTNSLVEPDEALIFTAGAATVNLGAGATETATVSFDGFTGFILLNVGTGETFNISGTSGSDVTGASKAQGAFYDLVGGLEDTFTYEGGGTGGMRVYHVGAQLTVETVPEPSSFALIGLGGLALILRRRK